MISSVLGDGAKRTRLPVQTGKPVQCLPKKPTHIYGKASSSKAFALRLSAESAFKSLD
jgi:hypothetical protein